MSGSAFPSGSRGTALDPRGAFEGPSLATRIAEPHPAPHAVTLRERGRAVSEGDQPARHTPFEDLLGVRVLGLELDGVERHRASGILGGALVADRVMPDVAGVEEPEHGGLAGAGKDEPYPTTLGRTGRQARDRDRHARADLRCGGPSRLGLSRAQTGREARHHLDVPGSRDGGRDVPAGPETLTCGGPEIARWCERAFGRPVRREDAERGAVALDPHDAELAATARRRDLQRVRWVELVADRRAMDRTGRAHRRARAVEPEELNGATDLRGLGEDEQRSVGPEDEIERRVQEPARILELSQLLRRRPRELSGGQ
ncbi:hypothetical protein VB690_12925, partial [Nodularia spumigena CH309]|nr:hypothetical protein [Nodularia spumigena CH309]